MWKKAQLHNFTIQILQRTFVWIKKWLTENEKFRHFLLPGSSLESVLYYVLSLYFSTQLENTRLALA